MVIQTFKIDLMVIIQSLTWLYQSVQSQTKTPHNKQTHLQSLQKDWTKTDIGLNKRLKKQ